MPLLRKTDSQGHLLSGNTFGAEVWSDGKVLAPMLEKFPEITKCMGCGNIFWIYAAKYVGDYMPYSGDWKKEFKQLKKEWEKAEKISFLSLYEILTAIENEIFFSSKEEYMLRGDLWQAFNDRTRNGEDLFQKEGDEAVYLSNILALLDFIDRTDPEQPIQIAELNRNLGNFNKCMEILRNLNDTKYAWVIPLFEKECAGGNKLVFRLSWFERK